MKTITIYSPKIAGNLLRDGFTLVDVEPNEKDEKRINFIFQDEKDAIRNRLYTAR